VKLGGLKAGGPYDLVISGKNTVTIHNAAVGEVWVCAGESNMEFKVLSARNGQEEIADASLPMVRVFMVKHSASAQPKSDCEGAWVVCNPDTVRNLSAVGYFFARELNQGMRVPFGLIQSAWGPSPAESWTPRGTLEKDSTLHTVLDRTNKVTAAYPEAVTAYQAKLAAWNAAKGSGSPATRAPLPPVAPGGAREPSSIYNGMISPLLRYPMRGVLWYQGESNTSDPQLYRTLFPAMIGAWRKEWNEGDFPFLYVQLSGFLERHPQPEESRWAEVREAQSMALTTPKTGMAVSIDTEEEHNMHPVDKQDVAHRLALIAESDVYGKSGVTASGPVFSGMQIEGRKAVLSFTHEDGGLAGDGKALKGFEIAGADRNFVWADAEIQGEKVIVQSKDVASPVAVRYAWADLPDCALFNRARLPASPFRTDDWVSGVAATAPSPSKSHAKAVKHRAAAPENE
jgi:sialate O-acetylesterase